MYLEGIQINNFRLFENLTLRLNPGLNILVGKNDSGKTALVDAIKYVLGTNSSERLYINENDFYNDVDYLSIQLKFTDVAKYAHVFIDHLSHEKYIDRNGLDKRKPVLYIQLTAQKTGQEKRGYPVIRTELKSGHNGNGLAIESEIRDFLATTYLKPLRDAEAELSAGKRSRLSQILNSSKDLIKPESINKILDLIATANSKLVKGEPIHNISIKITDDYLHKLIFEEDKLLLSAIIDIAGIKMDSLPGLTDIEKRKYLRAVLETLNLTLTQDRKKHGLGYHNLLFMAAELLLLEQEIDNEFPLLLLEEPEAHLHPQLQMKLLQFIVEKAKVNEPSKIIQCILTTHSPNISSKANPADIIIMNKGKAFSLRPEETALAHDDYIFLQKFLDVTKANLFFAKGIILVEGASESILLPTIAKLLGRPLENYGVSIVKYDNSGSWQRFVKIFLRKEDSAEQNPIKIAVMRDLDLWPDCAEEGKCEYGFKKRTARNHKYWRNNLMEKIEEYKEKLIAGLSKKNILVKVSDDWTFEYCLAKNGLFSECYEAIHGNQEGIERITGTSEEKAVYVQSKVSKTDFAYKMSEILEREYTHNIDAFIKNPPAYIIEAIEHVTSPFRNNNLVSKDIKDELACV